jgi:hypothetical protein
MKDFDLLSALEQYAHRQQFGGFNDFPPNWHEISEAEFAKSSYFTYSPMLREFRQMKNRGDHNEPMIGAHLHWMHDNTGFAIVNDFWACKIKFFAFGCKHEFSDPTEELKSRGLKLFACQHAMFCKKCNSLSIVDSSD